MTRVFRHPFFVAHLFFWYILFYFFNLHDLYDLSNLFNLVVFAYVLKSSLFFLIDCGIRTKQEMELLPCDLTSCNLRQLFTDFPWGRTYFIIILFLVIISKVILMQFISFVWLSAEVRHSRGALSSRWRWRLWKRKNGRVGKVSQKTSWRRYKSHSTYKSTCV